MNRGEESARRDLHNLEQVRGIFAALPKYINAKTIYARNNSIVANFAAAFYDAFRTYFQHDKELLLEIEQYRIKWRDEVVYDNPEKSVSIAFLLYKDGVGEITFQSSVTPAELERFVDLLRNGLYNSSSHLDIVSRLWQSDFGAISYRVFDESAEGTPGDGRGSGSESREQPLQASDHPHVATVEEDRDGAPSRRVAPLDALGTYIEGLVEQARSDATPQEKEDCLQDILSSLFASNADDLSSWRDEYDRIDSGNKLLRLLTIMLDFAEMRSPPPVVRDISDVIDRLVRYVVDEGHIPTLTALLQTHRTVCRDRPFAVEFQSLPSRIEHEITNSAFLLALGRARSKSPRDVQEVLQYFRSIGPNAVPAIGALLTTLKDPSLHGEVCDTLVDIAPNDVPRIVSDLNLDDPCEAKDAVYLLRRTVASEVHPVAVKLLDSSDTRVREQAIEYLAAVGSDQAVALLCELLDDGNSAIRSKTFAAVENLRHPTITKKVLDACFAGDNGTRSTDELERMYRAAGKLGGARALQSVKQMIGKGSWLRIARSRGRQNRLLAITALRHIPGDEALALLRELAQDGDSLVRTKAAYALKNMDRQAEPQTAALTSAAGEDDAP
jgi:hypothetical protein